MYADGETDISISSKHYKIFDSSKLQIIVSKTEINKL